MELTDSIVNQEIVRKRMADEFPEEKRQPENKKSYITEEELEYAQKGALEFREVVSKSNFYERLFLRNLTEGVKIQTMFLGLRAVSQVTDESSLNTIKAIDLPSRFKICGNHLYDEEVALRIVKTYSTYFQDFDKNITEIGPYLEDLLSSNPEHSKSTKEQEIRIDLLLGYPKDAVLTYGNYINDKSEFRRSCYGDANALKNGNVYNASDNFEIKLLETYGSFDTNRISKFLGTHDQEARRYFQARFSKADQEFIDFLIKGGPIDIKGFRYDRGTNTISTRNFPDKVKELFERSEINS